MSTGGISSIGSQGASSQAKWQNIRQQRQQDFQALGQALQSGDLSAAQQAFASLQKNAPQGPGGQGGGPGNGPGGPGGQGPQGGPSADFQALSQALSSGDLSAAQAAYSKLQSDVQAGKSGGHHHHHHHGGGDGDGGQSTPSVGSSLNTQA